MPEGAHPGGFRLLHGCELEIRVDGRLDYPDELLARYDVVVASLHVGRRQPRAQLMARYRTALRNPHVDIIAHPSGRKIGIRDDLDLDWDALYEQAAETATLLEVNGSDERLDLAEGAHPRARTTRAAASSSTPTRTIATSTTTLPGASAWHGVAGSRRATSSTRARATPSSRGCAATAASERLDSA